MAFVARFARQLVFPCSVDGRAGPSLRSAAQRPSHYIGAEFGFASVIEHQPAISGDSSRSKNHPAATKATTRPTVLCDCAAPMLKMAGSAE
jgi:hypothetical protein